ncbi:MAG: IMP cyclohydrolase [Lentisphaerae bacterium]|nr:IMP cyclohydrolase [Lentisphaerota bacterium]
MAAELSRSSYLEKNVGNFPEIIEVAGKRYEKVDDLRYGTNPHQPAAYYRPVADNGVIGGMEILKNGKNGLSQTNLEDISGALNIVKFFPGTPACAVMKHVNPSGAAVACPGESLCDVYLKARDADARAAFGSVIAFNVEVDADTANAIMSTFVECVVAPGYSDEALAIFHDSEKFKLNKHIRIIRCGDPDTLPKYCSDAAEAVDTVKILADGSLIIAAPLLTSLKSIADLKPARGENNRCGEQVSNVPCSDEMKRDLLFSWYVNLSVRSNGVVICSNGQTLSVGTGEQDRVGAIEQAIAKFEQKYTGSGKLENSVMSSDGFFPFEDGVETAAKAGIKAIIAPAGSLRDADVIKRANELGVALFHAPERIFSHH